MESIIRVGKSEYRVYELTNNQFKCYHQLRVGQQGLLIENVDGINETEININITDFVAVNLLSWLYSYSKS